METPVRKYASIEGVVWPPCVCGAAYKPTRPIEDYGTLYFESPDWIANTLYKIESLVKRLRKARLRSL